MEWTDEGVLLTARSHGENAAIIEVFTPEHGRHAGVVRGGTSRKIAPHLQPGAQLKVEWRARLEDHLGTYRIEPIRSRSAATMSDRLSLYGLGSVCALLSFCLPEREPHPRLYAASQHLFDALGVAPDWTQLYVMWEMALLEELGFGLDLSACAVTGEAQELIYISPKSGRAVSPAGAGEWANRLLPLPAPMLGRPSTNLSETVAALQTLGHFYEKWLAPSLGDRPIPEARARLVSELARRNRRTP